MPPLDPSEPELDSAPNFQMASLRLPDREDYQRIESNSILTTDYPSVIKTRHHYWTQHILNSSTQKSSKDHPGFADVLSNSIMEIVSAGSERLSTIPSMGFLGAAASSKGTTTGVPPTSINGTVMMMIAAAGGSGGGHGVGGGGVANFSANAPDLYYRHNSIMTAVYCIAYLVVFCVGLVGNCFVIAVVFRSPRMRTVTNFFIVNLAVADILVIVFCLPATLMSNIFVPWVLGWWMCKTVPYVQGVSVAASVYSLIAVSLDRFLAIWWPLKCQITKRRARLIIFVIWVIALTTTIPWALYFDLVTLPIFAEAPDTKLCLEVWPDHLNGPLYFLIANFLFCYILPMILISMCYILIWIKVWKRHIPTDTQDAQMERMQQKSKVKVVKMLVAVVILFVLSWLPLYVIFARIKFGGEIEPWEEEVLPVATPIAQWLGASNSCINPILYAFFNKKYRRGFVAIIKSRKCCGRLRYYETVALMSSSTSMRKSSHYHHTNASMSRRSPPGQDGTAVSFIYNNTGV